jgi:hypothetical protein
MFSESHESSFNEISGNSLPQRVPERPKSWRFLAEPSHPRKNHAFSTD